MKPLARIEVVMSSAAPVGVNGLVTAVASATQGVDADAALGLSGAAFRAYFFAPEDNWGWAHDHPDVMWRAESLEVDHYGALEALGAHTDIDVRAYPRLKGAELVTLLRHELEGGRAVLAATHDAPGRWGRIRSLSVRDRRWEDPTASDGEVVVVDVVAGATEPPLASVAPIRPSAAAHSLQRRHLLQRDVLAFVGAHARSGRELHHATELFFASGPRALEVAAALVDAWPEALAADAAFVPFATTWLGELARSRDAAVAMLQAWAAGVDAGDARWWVPPTGSGALRAASEAYALVVEALHQIGPSPFAEPASRAFAATCIRAAAVREAAAAAALAEADGRARGAIF